MSSKFTRKAAFMAGYAAMKTAGLTDTDIADALRVSVRAIETYRWNEREPTALAILFMREFLGSAKIKCIPVETLAAWITGPAKRLGLRTRGIDRNNCFSDGSRCVFYELQGGEKITLYEAAKRSGIKPITLRSRLRQGMSIDNAMAIPLMRKRKSKIAKTEG